MKFVAGSEVCHSAFCQVRGITEQRLAHVSKSVSEGEVNAEHGNKGA